MEKRRGEVGGGVFVLCQSGDTCLAALVEFSSEAGWNFNDGSAHLAGQESARPQALCFKCGSAKRGPWFKRETPRKTLEFGPLSVHLRARLSFKFPLRTVHFSSVIGRLINIIAEKDWRYIENMILYLKLKSESQSDAGAVFLFHLISSLKQQTGTKWCRSPFNEPRVWWMKTLFPAA